MAEYRIEKLNDTNANEWDEFNTNSREGSFFHSMKWKKTADKKTDFKAYYFLLFKNNDVCGIFPFVEQNIRFFRGLVPAYNLCPLLQDYRDPSGIQYVLTEFQKGYRHPNKISFILFSTVHREVIDATHNYPGYQNSLPGDMILNLLEYPPEKIWNKFSSKKGQRKFIRRFDDNGFGVTEVHSEKGLKLFYQYYKKNIVFIGGTLEPFRYIKALWDSLPENEIRITLLSKNSTIAGGLLMFPYKPLKIVYLVYLSLNRDLPNTYHPTYYLFWEAINWAWSNTYEKISFGPVPFDENNPHYRIKNEFCAEYEPIYSRTISLSTPFSLAIKARNVLSE